MGMPNICHSNTTIGQALTDMVQAIALEDAAIAHIINAEGEKLQKTLEIPGITVSDILSVNQSVLAMIDHLSDFEGVILAKLDKIDSCNATNSSIFMQQNDNDKP